MKKIVELAKGFVYVGVFLILFLIATNILDLFFENRQLTIILSLLTFFAVLVVSLVISKKISQWLDQQFK